MECKTPHRALLEATLRRSSDAAGGLSLVGWRPRSKSLFSNKIVSAPPYERNPVAIRNNTIAKLPAKIGVKMDSESSLGGASEFAAVYAASYDQPPR